MLELTIAMAILAFGLLGIAAAQMQAISQGSRGRHTSTAATIAQQQYEQILRMPYSSANLAVTAGYVAVPWINLGGGFALGDLPTLVTDGDGTTSTEHLYNVTYRVTADTGGNVDLRELDLRVTWTEDVTGQKQVDFSGIIVNNDL